MRTRSFWRSASPTNFKHGVDARGGRATQHRPHRTQVVAPGEVRVERGSLDQRANPGQDLGAMREDIAAQYLNAALRRRDQPQQHANRRRLACAVWTEEAEDLATTHLEAELVNGQPCPIALGEINCPQRHIATLGARYGWIALRNRCRHECHLL